jgi:phospholipid/cholesterol/gamma-HCH transport system ATP-binding protein
MKSELKIQVKSLYKAFGNNKVLNGIDLSIKKGSSLVILGGSGTGKSVLIKTIVGLIRPDSGNIIIDGVETTNLSTKERFQMLGKCGFLFQGGALFDSLTVQENITFFAEKLYKLAKKDLKELAESKLSAVGLSPSTLNLYPSELSGGMQKRVSLARAICTNPEVIFFDEPTSGLDPIMSNVINELIIKAQSELGSTTITITHDMNSAYLIAKEVALIHQGKILWFGTKEEMKNSDNPYLHQFINGLTVGPITF